MRVCYFGIYDPAYPRNAILRRGLEAAGVEVVECRAPIRLAPGYMKGPGVPGFSAGRLRHEAMSLYRLIARTIYLIREYIRIKGPVDAIILAEFNPGLAPLAKCLAFASGAPLIVDFLISQYDTAVNDRKMLKPMRPRAILAWISDVLAIRLGRRLLVETMSLAEYYDQMFGGLVRKAFEMQVGAPEWQFSPSPLPEWNSRPLKVLYYGYYIPMHGVEHIIRAARYLEGDDRFQFVLVGDGQTYPAIRAMYDADPSHNVTFLPPISQDRISKLVKNADVCIAPVGTSGRADRIVSNKLWQYMACGRPVIAGNGPGPRGVLENGRHCLLVPYGDPRAIAEALKCIAGDRALAETLARESAKLVRDYYSSGPLGRRLADLLREVTGRRE